MHGPVHKLVALAVCCCICLSGCAATAEKATGLFSFSKSKPPQLAYVKTPDDRIKELQQLRKTAGKKTPQEQQQISDELVKEIQRERDPVMRRQILRTLTVYPTPTAMSILVAGLSDGDIEVRRLACQCLGKRGGADAVRELTRCLSSDTNGDVRIAAVRALGETRDKGALTPLAEALIDPDPALQARAVESLTAVSGRHFGNNVQAWREFAQTGNSSAEEISLAERMYRSVF